MRGVSKISTYQLFDVALQGIVSHSKVPLRIATLTGVATAVLSMLGSVRLPGRQDRALEQFQSGSRTAGDWIFFLSAYS